MLFAWCAAPAELTQFLSRATVEHLQMVARPRLIQLQPSHPQSVSSGATFQYAGTCRVVVHLVTSWPSGPTSCLAAFPHVTDLISFNKCLSTCLIWLLLNTAVVIPAIAVLTRKAMIIIRLSSNGMVCR